MGFSIVFPIRETRRLRVSRAQTRLEHLARVARVIKSPGGNALLAGGLRVPVVEKLDGQPPFHMAYVTYIAHRYNVRCIFDV